MTGARRAAEACTGRFSAAAARSSSRPSLAQDQSRHRPSHSSAAYAGGCRALSAAVGGARWRVLRATRPCCHPRRSRFRWQAPARSGKPGAM